MSCMCHVKSACKRWKRIHLVDQCLLVILTLLMLQSALSLFFHQTENQELSSIDVVVRTSAAGIFGYLISANFSQRHKRTKTAQDVLGAEIVGTANLSTDGPKAQIGFRTAQDTGNSNMVSPPALAADPPERHGCDKAQILVVTAVGVVSLAILLLYRNFYPGGVGDTGSLTQFRDFVSGSVGFLISFSTGKTEVLS